LPAEEERGLEKETIMHGRGSKQITKTKKKKKLSCLSAPHSQQQNPITGTGKGNPEVSWGGTEKSEGLERSSLALFSAMAGERGYLSNRKTRGIITRSKKRVVSATVSTVARGRRAYVEKLGEKGEEESLSANQEKPISKRMKAGNMFYSSGIALW